ncbi:bis(5'-nucleosyl)-tetraphosphatase (symmetrical) YqeK [Virgibacillus alimentarius]|uniref:bis(5'-nucleosyl)-tetraphosphatase (symmetrical) n=1 Tax=Virgibacillus alimentarius TaxID=698769 RepID=A0ABS4S4Z9_9BACI|nr:MULTISPECIES: bis(5'-nucleosyl)-tetraphosphatase (symmetrical) YqeK [Virgibacillus]MBP2256571.1 putative HD superfamily hydrolase involved in NAD metabolism [Virgibacillus alimentarius]HLR66517.1 bis(5'-nucleosyl)-tetraphosphatase (symmetrical) YqeK [Virgibacillus sp.]
MKIDDAIAHVEPHLTKDRFEHTLRVAETAVELAKFYHETYEKAELAAIFHDYAKYRPKEELKRWIKMSHLPKDLLDYHHELWHGPVGALLIEREYGITDPAIQSAIRYHTTGKANMNKLDMILFLADYIEPGRSFPGLDEVRETAYNNLNYACWLVSRNTIQFLMKKNALIYPDSFHAYNFFTKQINGGNN